MKNLKLCNECDTVFDEQGQVVQLNADEFTTLEREQVAKWKCKKCVAQEQKERLIKIIQEIPDDFETFKKFEFDPFQSAVFVTVHLNEYQVLTTEYPF